MLLVGFE
ncbi:rCG47480, partial [Rattus norvegicus]